jgi:hypothetical protein
MAVLTPALAAESYGPEHDEVRWDGDRAWASTRDLNGLPRAASISQPGVTGESGRSWLGRIGP